MAGLNDGAEFVRARFVGGKVQVAAQSAYRRLGRTDRVQRYSYFGTIGDDDLDQVSGGSPRSAGGQKVVC